MPRARMSSEIFVRTFPALDTYKGRCYNFRMTYTTAQACTALGCKRGTLYNLMRRAGIFPRLGRDSRVIPVGPLRNFFSPGQLQRLMAAQWAPKTRLQKRQSSSRKK